LEQIEFIDPKKVDEEVKEGEEEKVPEEVK